MVKQTEEEFNSYEKGYDDGRKDWHATVLRILDETPQSCSMSGPKIIDNIRQHIVKKFNQANLLGDER